MNEKALKMFQYSNQQSLKNELIKVDEKFLLKYGIDFKEWCQVFKDFNLNPDNVYYQSSDFSKFYYLGEYVATDIFPDIEMLKDEFWGLNKVIKREESFEKMFKNKEYSLIFHPEYNPMALYYFFKLYKDIEKNELYETFIDLYQNISYGFDKIPEEIYEEVLKHSPSTEKVIKRLNEDIQEEVDADTELTIYRSQGEKSTPIEKSFSWTLSLEIAERFAKFCDGKVYQGNVKVSDIIDYLAGGEKEVLVRYENIYNIDIIA